MFMLMLMSTMSWWLVVVVVDCTMMQCGAHVASVNISLAVYVHCQQLAMFVCHNVLHKSSNVVQQRWVERIVDNSACQQLIQCKVRRQTLCKQVSAIACCSAKRFSFFNTHASVQFGRHNFKLIHKTTRLCFHIHHPWCNGK